MEENSPQPQPGPAGSRQGQAHNGKEAGPHKAVAWFVPGSEAESESDAASVSSSDHEAPPRARLVKAGSWIDAKNRGRLQPQDSLMRLRAMTEAHKKKNRELFDLRTRLVHASRDLRAAAERGGPSPQPPSRPSQSQPQPPPPLQAVPPPPPPPLPLPLPATSADPAPAVPGDSLSGDSKDGRRPTARVRRSSTVTLDEVNETELYGVNAAFFEKARRVTLQELPSHWAQGAGPPAHPEAHLPRSESSQSAEVDLAYLDRLALDAHPLVAEAKCADLRAAEALEAVYYAGQDASGAAVLVVAGGRLPPDKTELYGVMLAGIRLLEQHAASAYQVIYAHSGCRLSKSHFSWLREAMSVMPSAFRDRLKALHVVSPSFWVKVFLALVKRSMSPEVVRRILLYPEGPNSMLNRLLWPLSHASILPPWVVLEQHGDPQHRRALERARQEFARKGGAGPAKYVPHRENASGEAGPRVFGRKLLGEMQRCAVVESFAGLPRVLAECSSFLRKGHLDVEGLFRVSGRAAALSELQSRYDLDLDVVFGPSTDPHVVAGAYKAYLRELPEPLISWDSYEPLLAATGPLRQQLEDKTGPAPKALSDDEVARIRSVLSGLPSCNVHVLRHLVAFLTEVASHAAANKMTPHNLAVVFAPNVLRRKNESPLSIVSDAPLVIAALEVLLLHGKTLLAADGASAFVYGPSASASASSSSGPHGRGSTLVHEA